MRSSGWLRRTTNALPMVLVVAGLACASASCADFHRGPAPLDGGADPDSVVKDLRFEAQVYPILLMRCGGCHSESHEAGLSKLLLTANAQLDRAMILAFVTPGKPEQSQLLIQGSGGNSHMGGIRIPPDSPDYATVSEWIATLPAAP
jgi:hypothetical protein